MHPIGHYPIFRRHRARHSAMFFADAGQKVAIRRFAGWDGMMLFLAIANTDVARIMADAFVVLGKAMIIGGTSYALKAACRPKTRRNMRHFWIRSGQWDSPASKQSLPRLSRRP
jgi:hypothetical protein